MSQQGERRTGRDDDWWGQLYDDATQDVGPAPAPDTLDDRFASAADAVQEAAPVREDAPGREDAPAGPAPAQPLPAQRSGDSPGDGLPEAPTQAPEKAPREAPAQAPEAPEAREKAPREAPAQAPQAPVAYTHLTLPTNSEVKLPGLPL
ncbi:hypothetical protein [Streptomyces alfalfae]